MSWVTVIWSMVVSACLTLAAINLLVWSRDRRSWAHLCFSFMVVGVIGLAFAEMGTMKAASPEEFGRVIRWVHLVYAFGIVGSLGFVHFYFGTGRRWLLAIALGLRLLVVVINFTTGLNLQLRAILSLQKVSFLGEQVSVLGDWVPSPWAPLGYFATLVWLIYVVDASVALWRKGSPDSRRRAVIVGGSLVGFGVLTVGQVALVVTGRLRMPFIVSFPFLGVVLAMGYELSRDVLRAAQLGRDLRESEQRMTLAADAANLGVWIRDLVRNEIWATEKWRELFGFTKSEPLLLDKFLQRLHPDDREPVRQTLAKAFHGETGYETEYRVMLPEGRMRWIASRGRVEFNAAGKPAFARGISLDITDRKRGEHALQHLAGRLLMLQDEERRRVAGELHDGLGQNLAIIKTRAIIGLRDPTNLQHVREQLEVITATATSSILEVREIAHNLRPYELDRLGLVTAIESMIERVSDSTAISLSAELEPIDGLLSPEAETSVYRIVQESLNNVIRHSQATAAQIEIKKETNQLLILVRDNGTGIPSPAPAQNSKNAHGFGLAGIAERVRVLGGTFVIDSEPSRGTTLNVRLELANGTS